MLRGEIWVAHMGAGFGSEQAGKRPVVIIQNDVGNQYSPTVIVAAMTDSDKRYMPTHVNVDVREGMLKPSTILLEQIRTIDKKRLEKKLATLSDERMKEVDRALKVSLGLIPAKEVKRR